MRRRIALGLVVIGAVVATSGLWLAWPPLGIVAAGSALIVIGLYGIDVGGSP